MAAQVARQVDEHLRLIAEVERRRTAAEGDLVADQRGELVRPGRAADVAQESGVVDARTHVVGKPELLGEARCDEADGEALLVGLAHGQVGGQRERGHELGQAHAAGRGGRGGRRGQRPDHRMGAPGPQPGRAPSRLRQAGASIMPRAAISSSWS
jgi:hypothetical protein